MTQINTQLILNSGVAGLWFDNENRPWITLSTTPSNVVKQEYDHTTGAEAPNTYESIARTTGVDSVTFANGDSFDFVTGIYTFAENQTNRFQTTNIGASNIDTGMGANYYEEDLTTGLKKYFGEAFKFDGTQFEMDGDRIIGFKQSFLDNLTVDLTNIVNASITTATLTADNATINNTLTALGIDVTGLLTAAGIDVGVEGLTIADGETGHKHKLHFGTV